jgi:glutamate transport system substrate-binding protein
VNAWLKKIEADGTWAKLWKLTIGDRTGVTTVPKVPTIGSLNIK